MLNTDRTNSGAAALLRGIAEHPTKTQSITDALWQKAIQVVMARVTRVRAAKAVVAAVAQVEARGRAVIEPLISQ